MRFMMIWTPDKSPTATVGTERAEDSRGVGLVRPHPRGFHWECHVTIVGSILSAHGRRKDPNVAKLAAEEMIEKLHKLTCSN